MSYKSAPLRITQTPGKVYFVRLNSVSLSGIVSDAPDITLRFSVLNLKSGMPAPAPELVYTIACCHAAAEIINKVGSLGAFFLEEKDGHITFHEKDPYGSCWDFVA